MSVATPIPNWAKTLYGDNLEKLRHKPVRSLSLADSNTLLRLADAMDRAERLGGDQDKPEGMRYVQFSDTLARQIAADLRRIALP